MEAKAGVTKQGVRDLNHIGSRRAKVVPPNREEDRPKVAPSVEAETKDDKGVAMTTSSQLVIGCSEQLPHEVRAYRRMGTSSGGGVLLSRYGATYSAAQGDVSDYGQLLERMLAPVLGTVPLDLRGKARGALTRRWNRDWGVEAEDLIETDARSDRDGLDASANVC